MSDNKFTQGKWTVDNKMELIASDTIEAGNVICMIPDIVCIDSRNKWDHNALLISKAPEMLEMLSEMFNEWCETGIGENKLSNYMLKAKLLIKEATEL